MNPATSFQRQPTSSQTGLNSESTPCTERLSRLARICANTTESFSCFIMYPQKECRATDQVQVKHRLVASHSLSCAAKQKQACEAEQSEIENGLIGWVSRTGRPLSAAPFESSNYENIFYEEEQGVRSLLALPISGDRDSNHKRHSVLICDSKNPYAFNARHEKLLQELAQEVSLLLYPDDSAPSHTATSGGSDNLGAFLNHGLKLVEELGAQSVQLIRLNCLNYSDAEQQMGVSWTYSQHFQFGSLLRQALPQKFPVATLPNGDFIILLDRMMGSFYENRLLALADHLLAEGQRGLFYASVKKNFRGRKASQAEISRTIEEAGLLDHQRDYNSKLPQTKDKEPSIYEYRSA